jgi:hypothetical protein
VLLDSLPGRSGNCGSARPPPAHVPDLPPRRYHPPSDRGPVPVTQKGAPAMSTTAITAAAGAIGALAARKRRDHLGIFPARPGPVGARPGTTLSLSPPDVISYGTRLLTAVGVSPPCWPTSGQGRSGRGVPVHSARGVGERRRQYHCCSPRCRWNLSMAISPALARAHARDPA